MRTASIVVSLLAAVTAALAAPPTINSVNDDIPGIKPLRLVQTETLTVKVKATDPDGDLLTYSVDFDSQARGMTRRNT